MLGAPLIIGKALLMRTLRRTLYILLFLLIICWIIAWFVGRGLIQSRLVPQLTSISAAGLSYTAPEYGVGGFPFSYTLRPIDAEIRGDGQLMLRPSAQTSARVSMPGSLFGLATGGPVGASLSLNGTHELGNGWTLTFGQGSTHTNLSSLGNFSREPDWIYDGTDVDIRNLRLAQNGAPVLQIDRLRLDMTLLGDTQGHGYDFKIQGIRGGGDTFNQVPDTFDHLRLRGEIRPEINSALFALLDDAGSNPFGALREHGETYAAIMASRPGLYITEGEMKWGEAKLTFNGHMQPVINITALSGELVLNANLAGTGVQTLLQQLLREPALRQAPSELIALVGGMLSVASGFGLDLTQGSPSTLKGTLMRLSPGGVTFPVETFEINGRALR